VITLYIAETTAKSTFLLTTEATHMHA